MPTYEAVIVLRAGPAVPVRVLRRLWQLEDQGVTFAIVGELVRVSPAALLTADDWQFLRSHRDLVKSIISYTDTVTPL